MKKFLVLYRGGDAKDLSPKQLESLMKKWGAYMEKLGAKGALVEGNAVESSAAVQLVGKAKKVVTRCAGSKTTFVGGYSILQGKNIKAIQTMSKTCPHLTMMDGTIEIVPILSL